MAVLIDTPLWPAHGTVFCHLVSDSSLEQLHDLAERAGLPPGAFDRDHYDVPARLHQACLDAGALPTPMREWRHACAPAACAAPSTTSRPRWRRVDIGCWRCGRCPNTMSRSNCWTPGTARVGTTTTFVTLKRPCRQLMILETQSGQRLWPSGPRCRLRGSPWRGRRGLGAAGRADPDRPAPCCRGR